MGAEDKNQLAEMAKQKAEQQVKKATMKAAKAAAKAALKAIAAAIKAILAAIAPFIGWIILIIAIAFILLAAFDWLLDKETTATAAEVMKGDISQYISVQDDHFQIDEQLYQEFIDRLKKAGLSEMEFLQEDGKYLKAIIQAELATTYPKLKNEATNLDDSSFQGIVQIIRRSPDADDKLRYTDNNENEILMEYMNPEDFNTKLDALKAQYNKSDYDNLRKYFTIDQDTNTNNTSTEDANDSEKKAKKSSGITIKIATYNGSSVGEDKISYQNIVSKYSVPVEFLVAQLQVTNNPEYVYSLADMVVNNSKIDLVIQETRTTTVTKTVTNTKDKNGDIVKGQVNETTTVSYGKMKYIREVDTWIVNVLQEYYRKETSTTTGGLVFDQEGTFTETTVTKVEFLSAPGVSSNNPSPSSTVTGTRGVAQDIPEDVKARMNGVSFKEGYGIEWSDLSYLQIPYIDFNGNRQVGEMVVAKDLADDVLNIFEELYNIKYPIEKMELIDNYGGSDFDSIEANNTSAFNIRGLNGSAPSEGNLSKHSYGRCIDINPLINPYINESTKTSSHSGSAKFIDRSNHNNWQSPYKEAYIGKDSEIYNIFINHGWTWLGDGAESGNSDTQHFQKN